MRTSHFAWPRLRSLASLFLLWLVTACARAEPPPDAVRTAEIAAPRADARSAGTHGEDPRVPAPAFADLGADRRVSGPYVHANLAVWLVHASTRDDREFLTLDEGLAKGIVTVSEREQASVGQLALENKSKVPLFLQEGDRLKGGKQDRMVFSSLVVPPESGAREVPSFCIEQSRWSEGATGSRFTGSGSVALSPKTVRMSGKVARSQSDVWHGVASKKAAYASSFGSENTDSSLNEALDSKKVAEAIEAYQKALGDLAKTHDDTVGAVFVVAGVIEEVDVYPGHPLFAKVYPRLVQSFAADAAAIDPPPAVPTRTADDIAAFLAGEGTSVRDESIDDRNRLDVADLGDRFRMRTRFDKEVVHDQLMAKEN